jgi:hypothetical protein
MNKRLPELIEALPLSNKVPFGTLHHMPMKFAFHLNLGSLQLFDSANSLMVDSFPHIFFPAFWG